jgi:hypothetical protein
LKKDELTLPKLALLQALSGTMMMAIILIPAVAYYLYQPIPFVYFNLLGVSFVAMILSFKLECRLLGFNPFDINVIGLSPEVRAIVVRIASWFKKHQNAEPLGVFLVFLLVSGASLALGPEMDAITSPWLGFTLVVGLIVSAFFLMSLLQIVHKSAIHPPNLSVSELLGLMDKIGPRSELTPDVVTHLSKEKVEVSPKPNLKASIAMGVAVLALVELAGSGILGEMGTLFAMAGAVAVMGIFLLASMIRAYLSGKRTALQDLLDS